MSEPTPDDERDHVDGDITRTFDLGEPSTDLTKANRIAADLEDQVTVAKMLEGR